MLLNDEDKAWLAKKYPGIKIGPDAISGPIEFTATYNKDLSENSFLIIEDRMADTVGGLKLAGKFNIRVEERIDKSTHQLPALLIEGIEPIQDRHFNQTDKSACLCGPFQEEKYLSPQFQFPIFFEQLVIPFLYGQIFYESYKKWPWQDLGHGGIGILQSYQQTGNVSKENIKKLLAHLKRSMDWQRYEEILTLNRPSKRRCPCGSGSKFKDCHPDELEIIKQIKADMNNLSMVP